MRKYLTLLLFFIFCLFAPSLSISQLTLPQPREKPEVDSKKLQAPAKVEVKPKARDEEISQRLEQILKATGWFIDPKVVVENGVAFLFGKTKTDEYKEWAEELATNTQDTVAVVNQIEVLPPSIWEFEPVFEGLRELWRDFLRIVPAILFGIIILIVTWLTAKAATRLTRLIFKRRVNNPLILRVITWAVGLAIALLGLYSFFYIMGLTAIALTIIGGTGLLGIILGIAFKEITENLLASIFLSINNPFHTGDLIEIEGITGFVERLTVRSTILISLEGNYIQIPNATIYKSNIRNFTSNPKRREEFIVGIGYDCSISTAQEIALKVLKDHPAVLNDPEPWVLVDTLGKATVNLKIYFWLNGDKYSWLKVRSSVIRLIKRAFQAENIPMPDEARELIFPKGISIRMEEQKAEKPKISKPAKETEKVETDAEGKLHSEAENLQEQAFQSRAPEEGKNLLNRKSFS